MVINLSIAVLRALRAPMQVRALPTAALSRQERLGLIFSAIERCGVNCPACVTWALEQDRCQAALDVELTERGQSW